MKKIDVDKLADDAFNKVIKKYEDELAEAREKIKEDKESGLAAVLFHELEALRRHNERFTVELIDRVLDELQKKDD